MPVDRMCKQNRRGSSVESGVGECHARSNFSSRNTTKEICHEDPLLVCGRIVDFTDCFPEFLQK
jgi:hypothetical protein